MKSTQRAILVRLPESFLDRLDSTAFDLRMSRAAFIRRSLNRALEFAEKNELPPLRDAAVQRALAR
jgi:hypothetical protein